MPAGVRLHTVAETVAIAAAGITANSAVLSAVVAGIFLLISTGMNLYFESRRDARMERYREEERSDRVLPGTDHPNSGTD